MIHSGDVLPRSSGLHFSTMLDNVFGFYPYNEPKDVRYYKITAPAHAITIDSGDVTATNHLTINEPLNCKHKRYNGDEIILTNGCVTYIKTRDMEAWYNNEGQLHRNDGPALITAVSSAWYVNGVPVSGGEMPSVVLTDGTKIWLKNGRIHRRDEPAVIGKNYKMWFVNGKRHRLEGPAYIDLDGSELWYVGDHLHREYGPAVTWRGRQFYCLFGQFYREESNVTAIVDGLDKEWDGPVDFELPFMLSDDSYVDFSPDHCQIYTFDMTTDEELANFEEEMMGDDDSDDLVISDDETQDEQ